MIDREKILSTVGIKSLLESKGHVFEKRGKEWFCKCPFHNDGNPSLRVNEEKRVWTCDPCGIGGSVIDLMAKLDNLSVGDVLRRFDNHPLPQHHNSIKMATNPSGAPKITKTYDYHNELGEMVYQVVRCEPKTFRQRRAGQNGNWIWDMEGVKRVLYRLPEVMVAEIVFITEGEKDADTLKDIGFTATCNVGGAGKWMAGYVPYLEKKHIVICPDNDEPGMKHAKDIMASLAGKIEVLQCIQIPKEFKDITEFMESIPNEDRRAELLTLLMKTPQLKKGVDLPILDFQQMEKEYMEFAKTSEHQLLDLGKWIPSFRQCIRSAAPGDVVAFLADSGTGKTAVLQNLAVHAAPLDVLFFEMELTVPLIFERFIQIKAQCSGEKILQTYQEGNKISYNKESVKHIHVVRLSRLDVGTLEKLIIDSELRIGRRPAIVILDYIQLMQGTGKTRYEKMSDMAEEIKRIACATNTIIVVSSQVHRKEGDGNTTEIGLHDGKDSGSIENSSALHIGVWRSKEDPERTMIMRVNKATRSRKNFTVHCNFHGETMTITEKV